MTGRIGDDEWDDRREKRKRKHRDHDERPRSLVELTDEMIHGTILDDGPDSIGRQRWHKREEL